MQYSVPIQGVTTESAKACSWRQVLACGGGVSRLISFEGLGENFGYIDSLQMDGPMLKLLLRPVLYRRFYKDPWNDKAKDQFLLTMDTQWYKALEVKKGSILIHSSRNVDRWSCTIFTPGYIDLGQVPSTHQLLEELFKRITKGPAIPVPA